MDLSKIGKPSTPKEAASKTPEPEKAKEAAAAPPAAKAPRIRRPKNPEVPKPQVAMPSVSLQDDELAELASHVDANNATDAANASTEKSKADAVEAEKLEAVAAPAVTASVATPDPVVATASTPVPTPPAVTVEPQAGAVSAPAQTCTPEQAARTEAETQEAYVPQVIRNKMANENVYARRIKNWCAAHAWHLIALTIAVLFLVGIWKNSFEFSQSPVEEEQPSRLVNNPSESHDAEPCEGTSCETPPQATPIAAPDACTSSLNLEHAPARASARRALNCGQDVTCPDGFNFANAQRHDGEGVPYYNLSGCSR